MNAQQLSTADQGSFLTALKRHNQLKRIIRLIGGICIGVISVITWNLIPIWIPLLAGTTLVYLVLYEVERRFAKPIFDAILTR